jgi:hypothetical protein
MTASARKHKPGFCQNPGLSCNSIIANLDEPLARCDTLESKLGQAQVAGRQLTVAVSYRARWDRVTALVTVTVPNQSP